MNTFMAILHIANLICFWVSAAVVFLFTIGLIHNLYRNIVLKQQWAYCYTDRQQYLIFAAFGYFLGWLLT